MTGSSARGAAASLCASRWGIVNRAGTRGTRRRGCAARDGSGPAGVDDASRGESCQERARGDDDQFSAPIAA